MPKPDYTALTFPPAPVDARPYVIVNMVSSLDGKVTIEGTEQGIGSAVDQRLMRELRMHADIVLDGSATFRASGASPRLNDPILDRMRIERGKTSRMPIIATLTSSGNLPTDRIFFTSPDFRAVVYAGGEMETSAMAALLSAGRPVVVLPREGRAEAMLRHMREELSCDLLLVEGGPTINRMLFDIDAVDEVFLSVGPVIVGGAQGLGPVGGAEPYMREQVRHMQLVHAVPNEETNELYLRYRRDRA
jgi:5-amino-6-(5-phosphoribosylamino)uracil reductase